MKNKITFLVPLSLFFSSLASTSAFAQNAQFDVSKFVGNYSATCSGSIEYASQITIVADTDGITLNYIASNGSVANSNGFSKIDQGKITSEQTDPPATTRVDSQTYTTDKGIEQDITETTLFGIIPIHVDHSQLTLVSRDSTDSQPVTSAVYSESAGSNQDLNFNCILTRE